jgi:threonine aldolase
VTTAPRTTTDSVAPTPSATRSFASDNNAGVHPEVLDAIAAANAGHVRGYGDDPYTAAAVATMRRHLGDDAEVFFVFNGTGGNVAALQAMMPSYGAVLCSSMAHINVDECAAPERHTGGKLIDIVTSDGKLTPELLAAHVHGLGDQHHVQVSVVSLTQSTELGTVYDPDEIGAIAAFAHDRGLLVHVDGARLANAAASLGCSLHELTAACGVDALTFGGTKNGLLGAEAVVFFRPELARSFRFIRKQSMQLASKMRFLSVQFDALLCGDLWLRNARHANAMAQRLATGLASIPGITITQAVQANGVFAILPPSAIAPLQATSYFYVWNEATHEARLMCSWDTTIDDVDDFVEAARVTVGLSG